jgi:hypothetical protein
MAADLILKDMYMVDWKRRLKSERLEVRFLLFRERQERLWMKAWYEKKRTKSESGYEEIFEVLLLTHQVHGFEGSSTNRFYSITVLFWELAWPPRRYLPFLQFALFPLSWIWSKPPRGAEIDQLNREINQIVAAYNAGDAWPNLPSHIRSSSQASAQTGRQICLLSCPSIGRLVSTRKEPGSGDARQPNLTDKLRQELG